MLKKPNISGHFVLNCKWFCVSLTWNTDINQYLFTKQQKCDCDGILNSGARRVNNELERISELTISDK